MDGWQFMGLDWKWRFGHGFILLALDFDLKFGWEHIFDEYHFIVFAGSWKYCFRDQDRLGPAILRLSLSSAIFMFFPWFYLSLASNHLYTFPFLTIAESPRKKSIHVFCIILQLVSENGSFCVHLHPPPPPPPTQDVFGWGIFLWDQYTQPQVSYSCFVYTTLLFFYD